MRCVFQQVALCTFRFSCSMPAPLRFICACCPIATAVRSTAWPPELGPSPFVRANEASLPLPLSLPPPVSFCFSVLAVHVLSTAISATTRQPCTNQIYMCLSRLFRQRLGWPRSSPSIAAVDWLLGVGSALSLVHRRAFASRSLVRHAQFATRPPFSGFSANNVHGTWAQWRTSALCALSVPTLPGGSLAQ